MTRELADELRRVQEYLDEVWQSVQDADLEDDIRADMSAEIEEAAELLHRALRLLS